MLEPTIHDQAKLYLDGSLSYSELHRWVYDRIERFFHVDLDGTPESKLAFQLVGGMAEYDMDLGIFGDRNVAESEFRDALAAYLAGERERAKAS